MRGTVPEVHELGEYLRVEEIAHRFGVSVDDVLAACSVLGFPATGPTSLIEIHEFIAAIKSAPPRRPTSSSAPRWPRWFDISVVAAVAATFVAALAMFLVSRDTHSPKAPQRSAASATAYRAELKTAFASSGGAEPNATQYRALAQRLRQLTPPAGLRSEHDKLVAEAQNVADLASMASANCGSSPNCASEQLSATLQATSAASSLQDHASQLDGAPSP